MPSRYSRDMAKYCRMFKILSEIRKRPPGSDNLTFPKGNFEPAAKQLIHLLKTGHDCLGEFSRDVLLEALKLLLKKLATPLLTRSTIHYHQWLELGYYSDKVMNHVADMTPDLKSHLSRFMLGHMYMHVLLLVTNLALLLRNLAFESAGVDAETPDGSQRLDEFLESFRPLLMSRPPWFWLNVKARWKAYKVCDPEYDTTAHVMRFMALHADNMFDRRDVREVLRRCRDDLPPWIGNKGLCVLPHMKYSSP